MKALSIRQPWAWRILHEGKDIENRDWPTRFRGTFLIHASLKIDCDHDEARAKSMPMGGIVGMADIVDCVEDSASEWFFGRYGFVLANVKALPFMPCKGKLSFFTPDISAHVAKLWRDEVLSEGQCSKILGIDRIEFRELCDKEPGQ